MSGCSSCGPCRGPQCRPQQTTQQQRPQGIASAPGGVQQASGGGQQGGGADPVQRARMEGVQQGFQMAQQQRQAGPAMGGQTLGMG